MKKKIVAILLCAFVIVILCFALIACDEPQSNTYQITYSSGYGKGQDIDAGKANSGDTITLLTADGASSFSKMGSNLIGWKDQDGNQYPLGGTFNMPNKAVTLTAVWENYFNTENDPAIGTYIGFYLNPDNNSSYWNQAYYLKIEYSDESKNLKATYYRPDDAKDSETKEPYIKYYSGNFTLEHRADLGGQAMDVIIMKNGVFYYINATFSTPYFSNLHDFVGRLNENCSTLKFENSNGNKEHFCFARTDISLETFKTMYENGEIVYIAE